jgi:hypothetical protein
MVQDSRLAAIFVLAFLALASPAAAGPTGTWTQVTNFSADGSNTDEVGLARTPNGVLHVLWTVDESVLNTRVSADAQNVLGTSTVFTYTGGGVNNAVALLPGPAGSLRAFFAGLISSDENHDGGMSTATSTDGVSWNVQPTLASQSDGAGNEESPVYAAAGIGGTMFSNGTPLSVWGDSGPNAHGYHVGTSQATPDVLFGGSTATVTYPGAATDSDTGAVAVGWNDIDTGKVFVAFVQPSTSPWFPPSAATSPPGAGAADLQHPVGISGRSGGEGGIYVAYLRGTNPFSSNAAIWRVGAGNIENLSKADAQSVGVTAGPDGRLWAFWTQEDGSIHVRRSDTEATTWGADTKVKPPSGTSALWSLKGEGSSLSCGALDLVALATAGGATANFQQRVLPGLTLKKKILNGKKGKKAKVRFTTLDAGDPVKATVKFGKASEATGADGKVELKIKRKKRTRKVKATATDSCFAKATVKVKVTKKLPAQ